MFRFTTCCIWPFEFTPFLPSGTYTDNSTWFVTVPCSCCMYYIALYCPIAHILVLTFFSHIIPMRDLFPSTPSHCPLSVSLARTQVVPMRNSFPSTPSQPCHLLPHALLLLLRHLLAIAPLILSIFHPCCQVITTFPQVVMLPHLSHSKTLS